MGAHLALLSKVGFCGLGILIFMSGPVLVETLPVSCCPHELMLTWTLRRSSEEELVAAMSLLLRVTLSLTSLYNGGKTRTGRRSPAIKDLYAVCGKYQYWASNLRAIIWHMKDHKHYCTHCARPYDRCWCLWHWDSSPNQPTLASSVSLPHLPDPTPLPFGSVPVWSHARLRRRLTKNALLRYYYRINEWQTQIELIRCTISTSRRERGLAKFWLSCLAQCEALYQVEFSFLSDVLCHAVIPFCGAEYIGETGTPFETR